MTTRNTLLSTTTAALIGIFALTGCGGTTEPTPTPVASAVETATPAPTPTAPTTPDTNTEAPEPVDENGQAADWAANTDLIEFAPGVNSYTAGGDTVTCEADEAGNPATAVAAYLLKADDGTPIGIVEHTCLYESTVEGDESVDSFFDMSEEG